MGPLRIGFFHIADDGLPTIIYMHVLDADNLLTADGSDLPRFIQEMITLFLGEEAVKDAA